MNLYKSIAMGSMSVLFLNACGNGFEVKSPTDTIVIGGAAEKTVLEDMNLEELLAAKYDKAVLTCSLWLQHGEAMDVTAAPVDTFSWDLKSQETLPFAFELKGTVEKQFASVKIEVKEAMALANHTNHVVNESKIYTMKNTVALRIAAVTNTRVTFADGPYLSESKGTDIRLSEKVPFSLLNLAMGDNEKPTLSYRSSSSCILDTEIKPEYQDQFKEEDVK
ncbi:MAG: hypothetical protein EOP04_24935 [Proteobacteria bacterium]|nr:MAG: hypothetical protein EOP04_24935 [Pseudomonadota bacterium]